MRDLIHAVVKTVGGSMAALLAGMAVVKLIATLAGTEGVGLFSLLRQTQQVAIVLAMINGQNALVQGIASRTGEARSRYISTAFWIIMALSVLVVLGFVALPREITRLLMGQSGVGVAAALPVLGLSVLCGVGFTFCVGVLNGHGLVGRASLVQFTNYLVVALLVYPVIGGMADIDPVSYGWLLVSGTAAAALLGTSLVWRGSLVHLRLPAWNAESTEAGRHFLKLSSGLTVAGALGVMVPLVVRTTVVRGLGLNGAGVFDAAWTLSMSYVLVVLTSFSSYYLPALSGLQDAGERRELIGRVLRVAIILMLPLVTTIIACKPLVISLLYSREFTPSLAMIRWMLIGDYFKVLSWVFSYTMLAFADLRMLISTEVIWGALTLGSAWLSIQRLHSLEVLGLTSMLLYVAYFVVMALYVSKRHEFHFGNAVVLRMLAGLAVISGASALTWNDTRVRWPIAALCIATASFTSWMMLTKDERRSVRSWLPLRKTDRP
jgi:PST family polysaccharide transporter